MNLTKLTQLLVTLSVLTIGSPAVKAGGFPVTLSTSSSNAGDNATAIGSISFINGSYDGNSYSMGWSFTLDESVQVTALGMFNYNAWTTLGGTLNESAAVGIFDASGDLITSGIVTPTDPLVDLFNWTTSFSNTPVYLQKDQTYYIEAVSGTNWYSYSSVITTAPWLTFLNNNYNSIPTNSLTFPNISADPSYNTAFIGPNFQGIPEPSIMALLIAGLSAMGLKRRQATRTV